jgi:hypothetical protein
MEAPLPPSAAQKRVTECRQKKRTFPSAPSITKPEAAAKMAAATLDDSLLWLAYKEAKGLIQFDTAPLPSRESTKPGFR